MDSRKPTPGPVRQGLVGCIELGQTEAAKMFGGVLYKGIVTRFQHPYYQVTYADGDVEEYTGRDVGRHPRALSTSRTASRPRGALADGIWPAAHDAGRNNIKAEHVEWAREAIGELCNVGAVSAWDDHVRAGYAEGDKPRLIMPLIVEPKPGRPGKFRLIHDAAISTSCSTSGRSKWRT